MKVVTVELLDVGKKNTHDLSELPNLLAVECSVHEQHGWICVGGISTIQRQRDDGTQTILMQSMINLEQLLNGIKAIVDKDDPDAITKPD